MKKEGTFTITWKTDGDRSAETHVNGPDMPDQIKAMIVTQLLGSLAGNPKLRIEVLP